jgi:hypothetical protein
MAVPNKAQLFQRRGPHHQSEARNKFLAQKRFLLNSPLKATYLVKSDRHTGARPCVRVWGAKNSVIFLSLTTFKKYATRHIEHREPASSKGELLRSPS